MCSDRKDEMYRLDSVMRARVAPHFDVAALERLLQRLDPDSRPIILEHFLLPSHQNKAGEATGEGRWRVLEGFSDPLLNELLAEVWQPFWAEQSDQALDDPHSPYPGRERARQRRRTGR